MSGKPPGKGTKVTLGKNAPISKEATGVVTKDSLAAESQTFLQANETEPQPISHEELISAKKPDEGGIRQDSTTNTSGQGPRNAEPAPTYVLNQYVKYPGGPHGKNLQEDDSIGAEAEDKKKNASYSKTFTQKDPGLAAEKGFLSKPTISGTPAGREKHVDNQQPYAGLDEDTQA
ncbi:hypothetical protein F5Y00DRAFT_270044 [Daldinia vernicosa]|uniref:uncharacterized protein n=1 Tax=Daldinia vernicosa TaxID=114800 RepID=UPI002008B50C|nr:uncharacterized protein F5Y00DRAFT_270044 [Daldinia vernicosa]KAI0848538.1 hypothetical protein F5Y00DRAFT_270044 [Daldinia vernicosa]